jgi:hypothetical protein
MRTTHHPRRRGELKVGLSRAFVIAHADDENEGLGEPVEKDPASENEADDKSLGAESDPRDI